MSPFPHVFVTREILFLILFDRTQTGPIGTLCTKPAYRNRGLGKITAKTISKKIAESGFGVTACILEDNLTSRTLFENIGFRIVDEVRWIYMQCDWTVQRDFDNEPIREI